MVGKLHGKKEEEEELSEEDKELKENLDMLVERVQDGNAKVAKQAIEAIAIEIRTATSSMTSVPKPLKFLGEHYSGMKSFLSDKLNKGDEVYGMLADVLSVLAMTSAESGSMETLRYKLASGVPDVASWGHEYTRHLAGEIGEEFAKKMSEGDGADVSDLMSLVESIIPWNMAHNAEPEAVDLALEVDRLDLVEKSVDKDNCNRTCLYLLSCASYLPEPDDQKVLMCAYQSYMKVSMSTDAIQVALRMGDMGLVAKVMGSAGNASEKKQLAYILSDARVWIDLNEGDAMLTDDSLREEIQAIMG